MNDHPSIYAEFALAHERLAQQDAATRDWLDRACRVPDPDEREGSWRPLCACGCGLPAQPPKQFGPVPIYATPRCRFRLRDQLRKERES